MVAQADERNVPDLAIVDVQLTDGPCTELARALNRLGVPFVVYSGMTPEARPPDLNDVLCLTKPAEPSEVLKAIEDVRQGYSAS